MSRRRQLGCFDWLSQVFGRVASECFGDTCSSLIGAVFARERVCVPAHCEDVKTMSLVLNGGIRFVM